MRKVVSIEARMRSTRLPGKVLKPILGRPMLELMIERVRRAKLVDDIVVATTDHESCDPIEQQAKKSGVLCYRGSEEDVLGRVVEALTFAKAEAAIVLTGDMPVIDPQLIDLVVGKYLESSVDYCANSLAHSYPRGMGVQVLRTSRLVEASKETNDPFHREHATLYIREHPELFGHLNILSNLPPEVAHWRLCVDTIEDFELITKIYESLYSGNPAFSLNDMMDLFARHPEFLKINQHVTQKTVR